MTLTTEIKFHNCHATTCRGLCPLHSDPYIYSVGKFDSLCLSWFILLNFLKIRNLFATLSQWIRDKRRTGRVKVPDPTAAFLLISINQEEHEEN